MVGLHSAVFDIVTVIARSLTDTRPATGRIITLSTCLPGIAARRRLDEYTANVGTTKIKNREEEEVGARC